MKRFVILIEGLNAPGGARATAIAMYKALKELGYHVEIWTRERLDRSLMLRWLDEDVADNVIRDNRVIRRRYRLSTQYLLSKRRYIIINAKSNEILCPADVHYIHGPLATRGSKRSVRQTLRYRAHRIQLKLGRIILANSKYTANIIRKQTHIKPLILHPPVKSNELYRRMKPESKDDMVLTVSRIEPGRGLEYMPRIASRIKDLRFILAGYVSDQTFLSRLYSLRGRFHANNFHVHANASRSNILRLMQKAKIYLNLTENETFGIAIVEAMAMGCIPVVHMSGGPWVDVLNGRQGLYGYAYKSYGEAVEVIKSIKALPLDILNEMRSRAISRALEFDEGFFKKKFIELLKQNNLII